MATSSNAKKSTNPTTEDLADQVSQIRDDLGDMMSLLGQYGLSKEKQLEAAVKSGVDTAKQKGDEAYAAARLQAERASATAHDFVRDQPGTAVGIAAGIGFLIGLIASRR